MKRLNLRLTAAVIAAAGALGAIAAPAMAAEEQFVPLLVYRTGSFARWAFHGPTASWIT